MTERERFETYMRSPRGGSADDATLLWDDERSCYELATIQDLWDCWQAASKINVPSRVLKAVNAMSSPPSKSIDNMAIYKEQCIVTEWAINLIKEQTQ